MSFSCDRCDRVFYSAGSAHQHMEAKNHFQHECRCCYETWPSVKSRREHEEADHSYYYCTPCDRSFQNNNNLQQHLRSRIHIRTNIHCPFCRKEFATATGVTHHLETGACPNAQHLNRGKLYDFVRSKDSHGIISKNLLEWDGPSDDAPVQATEYAWNGNGYECYFCNRTFGKLTALNQHLRSPVHMQDLYHCPKADCRRDFKTLAALINHFESESCGFLRFRQVQNGIEGLVAGRRLLGY